MFFLNSKQIVLHYLSKFDKHPSLFPVLLFANQKRGEIHFRYYKHILTVLVLADFKVYTSVFQPCRYLPHVVTAIFNVAIETFFKADLTENSFMGIIFLSFLNNEVIAKPLLATNVVTITVLMNFTLQNPRKERGKREVHYFVSWNQNKYVPRSVGHLVAKLTFPSKVTLNGPQVEVMKFDTVIF